MISEASIKTAPHSVFDHSYEILDHVGRGRSSVVYKARKLASGGGPNLDAPIVALKVILGSAKNPAVNQKRMRHEALAMLACRHPNVIRLIDFVTSGDLNYLAMEYAERGDLGAILDSRTEPFSQQLALQLVSQLLGGLDAIHRAGIIHRDVKPENLLLTGDMILKVADFGIAHIPTEQPSRDDTERGVGTFEYLAPESLEQGISNQATDLYSAAVTAFQLLTKRLPFEGSTFAKQIEAKLTGNRPSLGSLIADPIPFLDELLTKALSSDPERRFRSAPEFKEAVDLLLAGRWRPDQGGGTVSLGREEVRDAMSEALAHEEVQEESGYQEDEEIEGGESLRSSMPWLIADESAYQNEQAGYTEFRRSDNVTLPEIHIPRARQRRGLTANVLIGCAVLAGLAIGALILVGKGSLKEGVKELISIAPPEYREPLYERLSRVSKLGSIGGSDTSEDLGQNSADADGRSEDPAATAAAEAPLSAIGGEKVGNVTGFLGDGTDIAITFTTVAHQGASERVMVALGLSGWKPVEVDATKLFNGEQVSVSGNGFNLVLTLDRPASTVAAGLSGTYTETITGRAGKWSAK